MMEPLIVVALIPITIALIVGFLGPIMVYLTIRVQANQEVIAFSLDHPDIPPEDADYLDEVADDLEQLGFDVLDVVFLPEFAGNLKALMLVLIHRKNGDMAAASVLYVESGDTLKAQFRFLDMGREFSDGSAVRTNNSTEVNNFRYPPELVTLQFPMIKDAAHLYRVHLCMVERFGSGTPGVNVLDTEYDGDVETFIGHEVFEEFDAQVRTGYFQLNHREGVFRPTFTGAVLLFLKAVWPMSAFRRASVRRRAHELLVEVGEEIER